MINVETAFTKVLNEAQTASTEKVSLTQSLGRVIAEDIVADRDFPPFNRVSMDGISISYDDFARGRRVFPIDNVQAAGQEQLKLINKEACMEVMTGAVCPEGTDTVIRYEDLKIEDGVAEILIEDIRPGQNVHLKGIDRQKDSVILPKNRKINAADIGILATVGKSLVEVYAHPKCTIISNGDELVQVHEKPLPHQIRRSNVHTLQALLDSNGLQAPIEHLEDDEQQIAVKLKTLLHNNDVLLLSGGVSMGKFDFLPKALKQNGVELIFHKVEQRPGKPFWFGKHSDGCLVFAFPGNPVSTFMCAVRYFLPWLRKTQMLPTKPTPLVRLGEDYSFRPSLQYFLQVRLEMVDGEMLAMPETGHGSGDLANLALADGFLELPAISSSFKKGELFPYWAYRLA